VEYRGQHAICDMILDQFPDNQTLENAIEESIKRAKMTVVLKAKKEFEPHGETVVWILSESHFTCHTYPEHNYISVDCYTCGNEGNPRLAMEYLKQTLKPNQTYDVFHTRGIMRLRTRVKTFVKAQHKKISTYFSKAA